MKEKSIDQDTILSVPETSNYTWKDLGFVLGLAILCYLFIRYLRPFRMGSIETILLLCYLLLSFFYVRAHYPIKKKQYELVAFVFVSCIPNAFYDTYFLKFFNFIFIAILWGYFITSASHKQIGSTRWILYDFINASILLPIRGLQKAQSFLINLIMSYLHIQHIPRIVAGVCLSIPLLLIIVPLLISADESFRNLMSNLSLHLDEVLYQLVYIIFAIPLFYYLYTLHIVPLKYEQPAIMKTSSQKLEQGMHTMEVLHSSIVITMEFILAGVYFIFLIITCNELLLHHSITDTVFSYSDFAREGFFELCVIALINLGVLLFVQVFTQQKETSMFRWMQRFLSLETILIITTAMIKMYMYIAVYGLTELRVYASWFMIVLFGIFIIFLFTKQEKKTFLYHIIRYFCVCFLFLNYINVNALITTYNTSMPIQYLMNTIDKR